MEGKKEMQIFLTKPLSLKGDRNDEDGALNMLQRVLSLFNNVRSGSDLTRMQLPAIFNIPKSQLQCYGESVYCVGDDMLGKCNIEGSPSERFIAVVAWSISTLRPVDFGVAPYNPILGETHHASRGTLNVLIEQISHHPPVSALHATDEKENLELLWCQHPAPKFFEKFWFSPSSLGLHLSELMRNASRKALLVNKRRRLHIRYQLRRFYERLPTSLLRRRGTRRSSKIFRKPSAFGVLPAVTLISSSDSNNLPAGILAVGRGNKVLEPVVGSDGVERAAAVTKMNLTLAADHHVFDGKVGVPPTYYAHLAAFRARFYMEPETSGSGSMTSGAAAARGGMGQGPGARSMRAPGGNAAVRPLLALKDNVKRVMFYC